MTTYSNQQWLKALQQQKADAEREIGALQAEVKKARADRGKVAAELDQAWGQLARTLAPSLEALPATSERIRLPDVRPAAMEKRLADEEARCRKIIDTLGRDARFVEREAKLNAFEIRLAELIDAIKPLRTSVQTLEKEPVFSELVELDYGSPAYKGRFWHASYYRHWKHHDIIMDAHGKRLGVADFPAMRAKYLDERAALAELERDRNEIDKLRLDVLDVERRVRQAEQELETLEPRALAWAAGCIREHLQPLDDKERLAMLEGDPVATTAARRVSGLEAKLRYLEELERNALQPPVGDLQAFNNKLVREIAKAQRPKNYSRRFTATDWDRRFGKDRRSSWQKRRDRLADARERIVVFHDYDRWDPMRDFLWWDVMTDGRLDGNFIREVNDRGPRSDDWRRDQAAAAVAQEQDDFSSTTRDIS